MDVIRKLARAVRHPRRALRCLAGEAPREPVAAASPPDQDIAAAYEAVRQGMLLAQRERDEAWEILHRAKGGYEAQLKDYDDRLVEAHARLATFSDADRQRLAHYEAMKRGDRLVELDFPVRPQVRFGHGKPPHRLLHERLSRDDAATRATLESFLPLLPRLAEITLDPVADASQPHWRNPAFPAFDAIALYGLIATRRPRRVLEIGSGFSTKFARRAIRDHGLSTRIVSIDPEPRAEVDAICDEVVRMPLEQAPMQLFRDLTAEDIVFFDGSHRAFQNSDATVFFTEILPEVPPGTLVGIHDIFWPADYPPAWLDWFFSEQYLLACWLLAGEALKVVLPVHHAELTPALMGVMDPFWAHPALQGALHTGGGFFFEKR